MTKQYVKLPTDDSNSFVTMLFFHCYTALVLTSQHYLAKPYLFSILDSVQVRQC